MKKMNPHASFQGVRLGFVRLIRASGVLLMFLCTGTLFAQVIETEPVPVAENQQETVSAFRFSGQVQINPFVYNAFVSSHGNQFGIIASLGFPMGPVDISAALSYRYSSFDGFDSASNFHGAWAVLGLEGEALFPVTEWLSIGGGLGVGWLASGFEYLSLGTERIDAFGLVVQVAGVFAPLKRLHVRVPLRLSLFFAPTGVAPIFEVCPRAEFDLFPWLVFFAETGLETWTYPGTLFATTQAMFILTMGARCTFQ